MTDEVKNYVEEMGRTFEEFKSTMETRLSEVESKGQADPLTETKLENIEGDLDRLEDFNQKQLSKKPSTSRWMKNSHALKQC